MSLILFKTLTSSAEEFLTYEGTKGPGYGKHIVFLASDHEYRSEEACPALARILAKNFGFKCTVLFGLDENGYIKNGSSYIPGMETLKTADLLFMSLRFQDWNVEQMEHFLTYLDKAKPVIGLRTSTHAFRIKGKNSKYAKFDWQHKSDDEWNNGFGTYMFGIGWQGHHGANHSSSTRIDVIEEQKSHPILSGVEKPWAYCAGYMANTPADCNILAMAQPLKGIKYDSPDDKKMHPVPAAWTRFYTTDAGKKGKVFCTTYGSSDCIVNECYRRMLINACFWALDLEGIIDSKSDIDFIGPFNPTFAFSMHYKITYNGVKPLDMAGWNTPIARPKEVLKQIPLRVPRKNKK
ncbi:MAG: ThuA domain-containing protein [Lentisphaeraceae bacterium]|nr:ThuA domain-containing protein [Lentisphaeraceae bacterium]